MLSMHMRNMFGNSDHYVPFERIITADERFQIVRGLYEVYVTGGNGGNGGAAYSQNTGMGSGGYDIRTQLFVRIFARNTYVAASISGNGGGGSYRGSASGGRSGFITMSDFINNGNRYSSGRGSPFPDGNAGCGGGGGGASTFLFTSADSPKIRIYTSLEDARANINYSECFDLVAGGGGGAGGNAEYSGYDNGGSGGGGGAGIGQNNTSGQAHSSSSATGGNGGNGSSGILKTFGTKTYYMGGGGGAGGGGSNLNQSYVGAGGTGGDGSSFYNGTDGREVWHGGHGGPRTSYDNYSNCVIIIRRPLRD